MDKYSFQPYALLTQLVNILLMICHQEAQPRAHDGFVSSLALFPDYSRATMDKVVSVIQRRGALSDDVLTQLISLIEEVGCTVWYNNLLCLLFISKPTSSVLIKSLSNTNLAVLTEWFT